MEGRVQRSCLTELTKVSQRVRTHCCTTDERDAPQLAASHSLEAAHLSRKGIGEGESQMTPSEPLSFLTIQKPDYVRIHTRKRQKLQD